MSTLPEFTKDVEGRCYGGAYWGPADYRIRMHPMGDDAFRIIVEMSDGTAVVMQEFTDEQADRLMSLVGTSEDADDEGLGLSRELHWHLGDTHTHAVDLDMGILEEMRAWFEFAFGIETYDGPEDRWEY
jgi:hypothetical protein